MPINSPDSASPPSLATFLQTYRHAILAQWEEAARQLPPAQDKRPQVLWDHLPEILDAIAHASTAAADTSLPVRHTQLSALSQMHALQRLALGFDLSQVVSEYSLLRDCVLRNMDGTLSHPPPTDDIRFLNAAIDHAIGQAVTSYTQQQQRTLQALDRISLTGLDHVNSHDVCQHLLEVMTELLPAVEGAALVLQESDRLMGHGAVAPGSAPASQTLQRKLDADDSQAFLMQDEIFLMEPADIPAFLRPLLPLPQPLRMLCGAPLMAQGKRLGTACIVSTCTDLFSEQDLQLFASLCSRISMVLAQHALRARLRASEARFRATFDQAAVGIAHVSPQGQWLHLNARFCQILGYSETELQQLSFQTLTHPDDLAQDLAQRDLLLQGETLHYPATKRYLRKDGSVVWVRGTAAVVRDAEGVPDYLIVVAQDISQLKQAEIERDRLLATERQARQTAESAIRLREDVLAIVSHDLRTPLASISMSATLLAHRLQQNSPEVLQQLVLPIQRATERMDFLIKDLLDMARLQSGRFQLEPQLKTWHANVLVEEAVSLHRQLAEEKNLTLRQTLADDAAQVCCERERILQVFSNLLGNAIKFCQPGQSITVGVEAAAETLCFSVSDTGPGIAAHDLACIFEPYWSAEGHTKKGTGLGLFISKGIVEAHQGHICADSTLGRGTRFVFTLPRVHSPSPS